MCQEQFQSPFHSVHMAVDQAGQHIFAPSIDNRGPQACLGIQLGATENAAAVKDLLTRLRQQGLAPCGYGSAEPLSPTA